MYLTQIIIALCYIVITENYGILENDFSKEQRCTTAARITCMHLNRWITSPSSNFYSCTMKSDETSVMMIEVNLVELFLLECPGSRRLVSKLHT